MFTTLAIIIIIMTIESSPVIINSWCLAVGVKLDAAASASMLASRRMFLAKDCREWNPN